MSIVELLIPVLATVLLTYTAAGLSTIFGSTRHLRTELRTDGEILASAPPGRSRADFRGDINRRLYLLTAFSRFPTVTKAEALLGILVLAILGTLFFVPYIDEIGTGGGYIVVLAAVPFGVYIVLHESWCRRSVERIVYLYSRLGEIDTKPIVAALVFPAYLAPYVVGASFVVLVGIGSRGIGGIPAGMRLAIFLLFAGAFVGLAVYRFAETRLYDHLRYFVPEFHPMGQSLRKFSYSRIARSLERSSE